MAVLYIWMCHFYACLVGNKKKIYRMMFYGAEKRPYLSTSPKFYGHPVKVVLREVFLQELLEMF